MTSTYNQYWKPIVDQKLAENAKYYADLAARESKAAYCLEKFMNGTLSALDTIYHPTTTRELWRCIYMFDKHPEYRERIGELAYLSPAWALIAQYWTPFEKRLRDEWPDYGAPKAAEKLKRMLASVR